MDEIAGWIAPAATVVAAMMTAANLGSRVTGWGFVVFVIGSVCWSIVGITSGQTNLVATNAFLTIVNAIGVWRWLGRQAKYDDGGARAAERSAAASVPTLFSTASLANCKVMNASSEAIGTIVDAMASCDGAQLVYVVVSEGGIAGVGERLHAIDPALLRFGHEGVTTDLTAKDLAALPVLEPDHWPKSLIEARSAV